MRKGFERVAADMEDLKLDLPAAPSAYRKYRAQAEVDGWLQVRGLAVDLNLYQKFVVQKRCFGDEVSWRPLMQWKP